MEASVLLILLTCIVVVLAIAYYLSSRQNHELKKKLIKQEPQFNHTVMPEDSFASKSKTNFISSNQQQFTLNGKEDVFTQQNDNLLLEEPLTVNSNSISFDKQVQEHQFSTPLQEETSKPENSRSINKSVLNTEIICLMLLASSDSPHSGYELLQSLLNAGLRYGPMNIFHRFEDANGRGKILFSVASVEEPGTFEITKMGAYNGKGLMMFLRFSHTKDLTLAFDIMLETVKQLSEDLGGQILDDEKQTLTNDKIEKWRKKIADFEQKQLIPDLFDV